MLFLHSHLDYLKENLSAVSDDDGERFNQEICFNRKALSGKINHCNACRLLLVFNFRDSTSLLTTGRPSLFMSKQYIHLKVCTMKNILKQKIISLKRYL